MPPTDDNPSRPTGTTSWASCGEKQIYESERRRGRKRTGQHTLAVGLTDWSMAGLTKLPPVMAELVVELIPPP